MADERTVTIPANSVVQVTGLQTVTVDQPRVSYVSVIGKADKERDPTRALPVVELAVALNAVF
ncbi:MAG: hypothetical protein WA208_02145 [Thermoanaerobaculia bacterium]